MPDPVKVLIVDDDASILTLLEEVFISDESLRIETQADSAVARDLLTQRHYDLMITDLMMPKVDGLMLLEHALSVQPGILVVIITGYASLETTLQAINAGVYDYITKPFRLDEFRLLVNNASAYIRLKHEAETLREQSESAEAQCAKLRSRCERQQGEIEHLRSELETYQALAAQAGPAGGGESRAQSQLISYQQLIETAEERYSRQLQNLENLFSSGRLTSREFEVARQTLKTVVKA